MISVGSPVHVRKLKPGGALDYSWDGVVLRRDTAGIVLRAVFNVDLVERDFATFRRGDVFHEFYFWDRCFNIFQVSAPDGVLKGWYSNVGLPAELHEDTDELKYVDLALDVWTRPDGESVVLDQEEYDEVLRQHPELREAAERGRSDLLSLSQSRELPRWPE